MLRIIARAAAGLALLTALSACYLTSQIAIPPERAEAVPGVLGTWKSADAGQDKGERVVVTQKAGTNDYSVAFQSPDQPEQVATARGFKLTDTIYVVQMWDETKPADGAVLAFLTVDANGVSVLFPSGDSSALATQAGVTVTSDGQMLMVDGDPAAILQFIELHKTAAFTDPTPIMVPAS